MNARRPSIADLDEPMTTGDLSIRWCVSTDTVRTILKAWHLEGRVEPAGKVCGVMTWRSASRRAIVLADPMIGREVDRVIAERHGVAIDTVHKARLSAGIRPARRDVRGEVLAYLREHDTAHTTAEIAGAIGSTPDTVSTILRRLHAETRIERLDGFPALWVIA